PHISIYNLELTIYKAKENAILCKLLLVNCHFSRFSSRHPAVDVALLARADGERSFRHVLADRSAAADVRALADRHRRHQLGVAADERAVLDDRPILLLAVVVARDGAGADVHLRADR